MICCRRFLLLLLAAPRRASRIKDLGPRDLVVVVHSGLVEDGNTSRRLPWLDASVPHVIVGGAKGDDEVWGMGRKLMYVNYDDNPGCADTHCPKPTYERIGKYFGAHRTVAGVLVANDTWPDSKWLLVVDDDNHVELNQVATYLAALDPTVPLLLAGRVGPGRNEVPCRKSSNATHWSCCSDPSGPCRARVSGPQAVWEYDKAARTFLPQICPDRAVTNYCCRTTPWPAGVSRGYPYRVDGDGAFRPHFAKLWPYGGAGYVLSRGLLDAIPRPHWEHCMYALQCANADHRVMTCVLAAGYSVTRHGDRIPGIVHHVRGQSGHENVLNSHQRAHLHADHPNMVAMTKSRHRGPMPADPRAP